MTREAAYHGNRGARGERLHQSEIGSVTGHSMKRIEKSSTPPRRDAPTEP
jgi:hypothetical protein